MIRLNGHIYCSCDVDGLECAMTASKHSLEPHMPLQCIHIDVLKLFGDMDELGM